VLAGQGSLSSLVIKTLFYLNEILKKYRINGRKSNFATLTKFGIPKKAFGFLGEPDQFYQKL
jgi:hypothetical protein